jgi:hypothetical protein
MSEAFVGVGLVLRSHQDQAAVFEQMLADAGQVALPEFFIAAISGDNPL